MSTFWENSSDNIELVDFQWYVIKANGEPGSGLYSGDDIKLCVTFRIQALSSWKFLPWWWKIVGTLDGKTASDKGLDTGTYAGRNDLLLVFTGKMPYGKDLRGKFVFYSDLVDNTPVLKQFAEVPITIPNLDDFVSEEPNGIPPAVCAEGQERCEGFDRYVCRNNRWVVKEYNSAECFYIPEPICTNGDTRCVEGDLQVCVGDHWEIRERNSPTCGYVPPDGGEPTPPTEGEGIGGWFDRNKTAIIIVSAAVLVICIIVLATKTRFQSPVAAWPKFQLPVVRK